MLISIFASWMGPADTPISSSGPALARLAPIFPLSTCMVQPLQAVSSAPAVILVAQFHWSCALDGLVANFWGTLTTRPSPWLCQAGVPRSVLGHHSPSPDWLQQTAVKRWATLDIGESHGAGISCEGKVYTWGRNNKGQLG